jgi:hypothetical protein
MVDASSGLKYVTYEVISSSVTIHFNYAVLPYPLSISHTTHSLDM